MGCGGSCIRKATMSMFGKNANNNNETRAKLERKLYIAKESPGPDFDLSECHLQHVPSGTFSICKVYRKEYLYLQHNNLQSLDDGGQVADLYLTKVLNISYNKFTQLPDEIRYLVNLTELYLQENMIKHIPDSIQHMQCLQILDVSKNNLKKLTPSLGKLKCLRKLIIIENEDLTELCPELCFASNIIHIDLNGEHFTYPPANITTQDTKEIMKFLCMNMNIKYLPPIPIESNVLPIETPNAIQNPFVKQHSITWEEQEAAIIEQENKIHKAAKEQRDHFLSKVLEEQLELDSEIAKVHEAKELERQKLIKAIQEDENEIQCLVNNFIQSDYLKPEVIQQQLAHEQAEHDRLLEITRQNYDNVKKSDGLRAMEMFIEDDYAIQYSKKHYEDSLNNIKQSMLLEDIEVSVKIAELLQAKDQSHTVLVGQLLEDQDIQKAIVASLLERVDARCWSLNQEISLISLHLARLSVIEQEKKKLQIGYNYNELLQQRVHLVNLLDDLFSQQYKRKKQLIETLKEMEMQTDNTTDYWLKNYQKLINSAPKTLLNVGKSLDPALANYLLQEGVIHCLPFMVKFLFSDGLLTDITLEKLKESGVSLSSDREGIIRAINCYVKSKTQIHNYEQYEYSALKPSAPPCDNIQENMSGVVSTDKMESTMLDSECVICMDTKCEVVFIPCGHMCCCQSCSNNKMEGCPMCRTCIERTIKVIIV